jgi:hypothetical protein
MLIVEKQSFCRLRSSGMHGIVHEYVEVDICHGFTREKGIVSGVDVGGV